MNDESGPMPGDRNYQERLGATLRLQDKDALRAFLIEQARTFGGERQVEAVSNQSDAELELLMHRMILARPDLADLHPASRLVLGMEPASKQGRSARRRR
jgi:hypothetical protein